MAHYILEQNSYPATFYTGQSAGRQDMAKHFIVLTTTIYTTRENHVLIKSLVYKYHWGLQCLGK